MIARIDRDVSGPSLAKDYNGWTLAVSGSWKTA